MDKLSTELASLHLDGENGLISDLVSGDLTDDKVKRLLSLRQGHVSGPYKKILHVRLALIACRQLDHSSAVFHLSQCHSESLRQSMVIKSATLLAEQSMKAKSESKAPDQSWLSFLTARRGILSEWSTERGRKHLETLQCLLPAHCTVLQLTARPRLINASSRHVTPSLLISRFSKNSSPLVAALPAPQSTGCTSFSTEFDSIMSDNVSSMRRTSQYRVERAKLDARVRNLISSMQTAWIGWRAYLLAGESVSSTTAYFNLPTQVSSRLSDLQRRHIDLLYRCLPPSNGQVRAAVAAILGVSVRHSDCRTIADLLASHRSLPSSEGDDQQRRNHVILVVDASVQKYPWECIRPLCEGPVSRVPSLSILHLMLTLPGRSINSTESEGVHDNRCPDTSVISHNMSENDIARSKCVSDTSVCHVTVESQTRSVECNRSARLYILNPSGDLQGTERRLRPLLKRIGWQGVVGRAPSVRQLISTLTDGQLMAYMGHGSGSRYLPAEQLRSLRCNAVALLFGCGSGQLVPSALNGEPHGSAYNYVTAGCRQLLGFLWSVTDVQLDRFTNTVLTEWLGDGRTERCSLSEAVRRARTDAVSSLMAAAAVIYGVPETSDS